MLQLPLEPSLAPSPRQNKGSGLKWTWHWNFPDARNVCCPGSFGADAPSPYMAKFQGPPIPIKTRPASTVSPSPVKALNLVQQGQWIWGTSRSPSSWLVSSWSTNPSLLRSPMFWVVIWSAGTPTLVSVTTWWASEELVLSDGQPWLGLPSESWTTTKGVLP